MNAMKNENMHPYNVYIKFRSTKNFVTIPIDGNYISVSNLRKKIIESNKLWWRDHVVIVNAQTGEELDEVILIPKHSSLIVRRLCTPEWSRPNIVVDWRKPKGGDNNVENEQPAKNSLCMAESSSTRCPEEIDLDDFGDDVYAIHEALPVQSNNRIQNTPASDKADECSNTTGSIDSSDSNWKMQTHRGFAAGRGSGRGMSGSMIGRCGFGQGGFELKKPSHGYICFRCNVPGHFIQHCPTKGDPNYDIKWKHSSTAVSLLKPSEVAFDREMRGLSSAGPTGELPPELHCPLCKEVMEDAMMTIKCCFPSFCYTCIRNHLISKSLCFCGARSILADDLVPNKTIRDTINGMLKSNNSTENSGSALETQESACYGHFKSPVPMISATFEGGQMPQSLKEETPDLKVAANSVKPVVTSPQQSLEKGRSATGTYFSEVIYASVCEEEPKLEGSKLHAEKELEQKLGTLSASSKGGQMRPSPRKDTPDLEEAANGGKHVANTLQQSVEKGRSATDTDVSGVTLASVCEKESKLQLHVEEELQQKLLIGEQAAKQKWRTPCDLSAGNGMVPYAYPTCDRYWSGVGLWMDGYTSPDTGAMCPMGYAAAPFNERKVNLKRKHESNQLRERACYKDGGCGREQCNNVGASSMKSKHRIESKATDHNNRVERAHSHERFAREPEPVRHVKKITGHHDVKENKHKASRFSPLSFPEDGVSKKRKLSSAA